MTYARGQNAAVVEHSRLTEGRCGRDDAAFSGFRCRVVATAATEAVGGG